jgi:hypothetical protein
VRGGEGRGGRDEAAWPRVSLIVYLWPPHIHRDACRMQGTYATNLPSPSLLGTDGGDGAEDGEGREESATIVHGHV